MSKIAIISASPPNNKNTGMLTVELASASLRSKFPDVEFNWFAFPPNSNRNVFAEITKSPFPFKYLPDCIKELYEHDIIFYWGDFLNSRSWMYESGALRVKQLGYSAEEAREVMVRCMLLRDAPEAVLKRTLLFGGTILPNKQSDYEDEAYHSAFTRLVSQCHQVWMREPISAARVAMLRNNQKSCLGVDAALLLPKSAEFPTGEWSEEKTRRIGLFVGSRSPVTKELIWFAKELAREFKADLDWLPWFKQSPAKQLSMRDYMKSTLNPLLALSSPRNRERQRQLGRKSRQLCDTIRSQTLRSGQCTFGDILRQLSFYEFIITDTYHVCINAWRLGVPAICVGLEQPSVVFSNKGSTLVDLKKYVFYLTYQATDLYFTLNQLKKDPEASSRAATIIKSSQSQAISNRIQAHAQQVKSELLRTMQEML